MSVGATGSGALRYQWRFNGLNLPGATNASLTISNVTPASAGPYTVVVTDDIGPVTSPAAILTVQVPPVILLSPVAQTVFAGGPATFTCIATGTPAPYYRWLRNGSLYASNTFPDLVITNCQSNGTFRVTVGNVAGTANSLPAGGVALTVLRDFDGDGLPDPWEAQYGFNTNNAADALLDFDGDGMSNRDEYIAGTNPTDPLSLLKLTLMTINPGQPGLQFVAQSNIAYSVQQRTNLSFAPWSSLTNIGAQSLVRTVEVVTPNPPPTRWERFYRVVTPPSP